MPFEATTLEGRAIRIATLTAVISLLAPVALARGNDTFSSMIGDWIGSGTVTASGNSERIACRIRYAFGEDRNSLIQNLVCASASYRFDIASAIYERGSELSGQWTEKTRGIGGRVVGRLTGNQINAEVEGQGFTASLHMATGGDHQSVSIRPQRSDVSSIAISLRRAR
jgi:hypothetical protein